MADNAAVVSDSTTTKFTVAADEVTYSGDTTKVQIARLVHVSGSEGSKTLTEICDTTGLNVHPQPATAGGCSTYHVVAAATANAANIKASAGQIYGIDAFNNAGYPIYIKFHNTAGTPTAGASVVRTFGIQAGVRGRAEFPTGLAFGTGIGITIVKDITDAGATAVALSDCVVDVDYK